MPNATANPNGRHIALVSETFVPEVNGVTNTLKHLCLGLMQQGHRVTVIRPRQKRETAGAELAAAGEALFSAEVLVPGAPLPGYPELRFGLCRPSSLRRIWTRQRPDAVYIATQGPLGVAAAMAARRLGIPVSSGFHTNFHSYSHYYGAGFLAGLLCRYGRWFHNRTDLTLVPTRRMQRQVRAMGIDATSVWSRGVDCQRFAPHKHDPNLRQQWGLAPGDRAILYVGRLAAEKNLQMAVACYERIRQLHPRARFILVGDGPLRERLAARHPDYVFCGIQHGEALARHFASGDLFLFPSKTDTFGNVVTEAMASGLAVVAYDDAAAGEHLRHEDNGMVVALEDDEGFVTAALKLLDQPTLLARVRGQARLDALDLQWSVLVEQFANLILSVQPKEQPHAVKQSLPIL